MARLPNFHDGLQRLTVTMDAAISDADLRRIQAVVFQRIDSSPKGVLLECRGVLSLDERCLQAFVACQRHARFDNKRFALLGVSQDVLQYLLDHRDEYDIDIFGMTDVDSSLDFAPQRRAVLASGKKPRKPLWSTLRLMVVAGVTWLMTPADVNGMKDSSGRKRPIPWKRWAMLVIVPIVITLPVLVLISESMNGGLTISVQKSFEDDPGLPPGLILRGKVQVKTDTGRQSIANVVVIAWVSPPADISPVAGQTTTPTRPSWSTRTGDRGLFELAIPGDQLPEGRTHQMAVFVVGSETLGGGFVTAISDDGAQPTDLGHPFGLSFATTVKVGEPQRFTVLLDRVP